MQCLVDERCVIFCGLFGAKRSWNLFGEREDHQHRSMKEHIEKALDAITSIGFVHSKIG